MPPRAWSHGSPNGVVLRVLWGKKRPRHPAIDDDASRVPLGHHPPDPLRLPAQAQFVAQSDRDLLRHHPPEMPARRQLHLGGRPRVSAPTVHHLLQHDDGPSLRLDLHRQASSEGATPPVRPASPACQDARIKQTTKPRRLMKLRFRVAALATLLTPNDPDRPLKVPQALREPPQSSLVCLPT